MNPLLKSYVRWSVKHPFRSGLLWVALVVIAVELQRHGLEMVAQIPLAIFGFLAGTSFSALIVLWLKHGSEVDHDDLNKEDFT